MSNYKIAICYITHTKFKTLPSKVGEQFDIDREILDEYTNDDPYYEVLDEWDGECVEQFDTYEDAQNFIKELERREQHE